MFSIQYPSDWQILAHHDGSVVFSSPLDFSSGRHISTVNVGAGDVKNNVTTLDQLVSQFKSNNATKPLFDTKIIDESSMTLSGVPAHKIIEESKVKTLTTQFTLVEILAFKNGKQYTITYKLGQSDDLPIVQQMVDSFQIIK